MRTRGRDMRTRPRENERMSWGKGQGERENGKRREGERRRDKESGTPSFGRGKKQDVLTLSGTRAKDR